MGNFKTIFTDKFQDKDPPAVFHRLHWGEILSKFLTIKTEYCRNNNLKFINLKERAGKNRDRMENYSYLFSWYVTFMLLIVSILIF